MDLAPVPRELHGEFYSGDSYVLLYTGPGFSYNVHSWLGKDACQNERGSAAIFMTQLDDFLGGAPRQFTEFQDEESDAFMSLFKSGVNYKPGGVASGFKHVVTNDVSTQRLLHVKGRRQVRANEVDLSWSSFNNEDCFIIDLGKTIYHWSGSKSNPYERLKTTELAIDIRDNEKKGRANLEMIVEGSEPEEVIKVLGPKPDLPSASSDDASADKTNKNIASLYLISDAAGSMKTTLVADKNPFKQDMLSQDECYILDNGANKKIFVWKGKNANADERKAAFSGANKFIQDKNYPPNTQIRVMPAGGETTVFKQFFFNWLDKDETTGPSQAYIIGSIARVEQIPFDASKLHSNTSMAAQHGMVDDGSGKVQIWRVEEGDKAAVDPSTYGQFFGGDCYLVLYSYNDGGREKHIIYTWQGQKCSKDELTASAFLTVTLDDSMGGVATQVRVTQGQEPPHLVSLFKDKPLVIHLATRAVEVQPTASSLNTNDMFVLKTPDSLFLWKGKGGTPEEMTAAKYVADLLGGTVTEVEETEEPDGFWTALGGKGDYQTSKSLQKTIKAPRLFACSNKTGRLIAEEVPGEFTQIDLATDDIMVLDVWDQIFIWVGKDANETEKAGSPKIAQDYVDCDPSGRSGVAITTIKQGAEPSSFTGWFHAWDPKLWDKDLLEFYATMRNLSNCEPLVEAVGRNSGQDFGEQTVGCCDEASIKASVDSLHERRVDIFISNAEMGLIGPIECHPIDEMKTVMDTNFFGFVRLLKEVLPDMKRRKKGHIVIISSVMGIQGEDETLS
ncbi:Adseverin Gelsolin-like protein Scinderin [Larimichthys crocea]|uniref:Adseverin Gelsolin-like protein Scinderin n=1 Tax=Larimichthys crocea TaxID=215358 RepID=A0A6G0IQL8_LARCR|nr:Adseverin Gelsolin-like protein Scinderin [Larimichthys crocea]